MSERIQWIVHKGKRMLYIDASNLRDEIVFLDLADISNAKARGIPTGPTACVGSSGFQRAVVQTLQYFIKEIHISESIEEAKEWLAAQEIY